MQVVPRCPQERTRQHCPLVEILWKYESLIFVYLFGRHKYKVLEYLLQYVLTTLRVTFIIIMIAIVIIIILLYILL